MAVQRLQRAEWENLGGRESISVCVWMKGGDTWAVIGGVRYRRPKGRRGSITNSESTSSAARVQRA